MREHRELVAVDFAVVRVHARHVDFGGEGDVGVLRGVVRPALDRQEVNAVVVVRVLRPNYRGVPVRETLVVTCYVKWDDGVPAFKP